MITEGFLLGCRLALWHMKGFLKSGHSNMVKHGGQRWKTFRSHPLTAFSCASEKLFFLSLVRR